MKNTAVNVVIGLILVVLIGLLFVFYGELKDNQSELKVLSSQVERLQLEIDSGIKKNNENRKNIELNQWEISRLVKRADESKKNYNKLEKKNVDCLKNISESSQKLAEFDKKLNKLKVETAQKVKRKTTRKKTKSSRLFSSLGADEKLSDIKLPPNATKEQTEEYIDKILAFSQRQRVLSGSDPQIEMLEKIPHKYLPLLADRLTEGWGPKNYHVSLAVANLAEESDKDFIIKRLARYPNLISTVIRYGWEKDVKDIIFHEMAVNKYLTGGWITCARKLAKTENYGALIKYLIQGQSRYHTYKTIKDLPGIKLDEAVAQIWCDRENYYSIWEKKCTAFIAADYGYIDALKALIELRKDKSSYLQKTANWKMYSLTGQSGSYDKLKKWFDSNKSRLFFDKKKQRYLVKK